MPAVLLDIEGTTTPIEFVHRDLFGYARRHLRSFLAERGATPEVRQDLDRLRAERAGEAEAGAPEWREGSDAEGLASAAAYVTWLMDRDRKSTALKSLQGRIWEAGYRSGELVSAVYPDVRPALERWRREGRVIAIYSSGSVFAQKLLFAHTTAGDLTPLIDGWFDTAAGPKREAESYRGIAASLGLPPGDVLFVSDVVAELDAAAAAFLRTALCVRAGTPPASPHRVIHDFDKLSADR